MRQIKFVIESGSQSPFNLTVRGSQDIILLMESAAPFRTEEAWDQRITFQT